MFLFGLSILLVFSNIIFPIELEIDNFSIDIEIEGNLLTNPFFGGFNKPKVRWLDWNQDGYSDLFVTDGDGYIKFYERYSSDIINKFELKTTFFGEVQGGNWFFINDFDLDGDFELIVQDSGEPTRLLYFENSDNVFINMGNIMRIDEDYVESPLQMTPTFADIDADGDYDFFTCTQSGNVIFYENVESNIDNPPIYEYKSSFWQEISIIGTPDLNRHGAASITFIDIDLDGDLDLSWGDFFQNSLYVIYNLGTSQNPIMDNQNIVTNFPENYNLYTAGQNMPNFSDVDLDGDLDLFITVLSGAFGNQYKNNFFYFENTSENGNYFEYDTNDFMNGLDFISGSFPELSDIDLDGDLDLFISNRYDDSTAPWNSRIIFFENQNNNKFVLRNDEFLGINLGVSITTDFIDIDLDGDLDLFIGDVNGIIKFYKNHTISTDYINFNFNFSEEQNIFIENIDLSGTSVPAMIDIDNDQDYDLVTGEKNGLVRLYENIGDEINPLFNSSTILVDFENIYNENENNYVDYNVSPEFFDVDNDCDFDMFLGTREYGIIFFKNIGTPLLAEFSYMGVTLPNIKGKLLNTSLGYINNNLSMLVGNENGGLYHYKIDSIEVEDIESNADVNYDEITNILDVVQIVNFVLDNVYLNSCQEIIADFTGEGIVNILDIIQIVNAIINK